MRRLLSALVFVALGVAPTSANGPVGNADAAMQRGDYPTALYWYRVAANQGYSVAEYNMGYLYFTGLGGEHNLSRAEYWLRKAAGDPQLMMKANELLTKVLVAEAQGTTTADTLAQDQTASSSSDADVTPAGPVTVDVQLTPEGGTYTVPVLINDAITLGFTVDSGAADVTIPLDVFSTLARAGTIADTDITGEQDYTLADGSTKKSPTFIIRSLQVGALTLKNVPGSVSASDGVLLLGQTFLKKFQSWSIDNAREVLVLTPDPQMVFDQSVQIAQ